MTGDQGIASLHRVLNSYALYNPEVGYCQVWDHNPAVLLDFLEKTETLSSQAMNFIAGILLIMDLNEEDAFWIISHISDSVLPHHFAPPMIGSQVSRCLLLRKSHLHTILTWSARPSRSLSTMTPHSPPLPAAPLSTCLSFSLGC